MGVLRRVAFPPSPGGPLERVAQPGVIRPDWRQRLSRPAELALGRQLWSSWHGFFSWSPVAYIAFAATFFYAVRNRRWAIAAILVVPVMAWVNGATADWAGGGGRFGGRRFVSVLVVLAPGLVWVVHGLTQRPMVALSLIAAAAIGWNQLLIAQHARGLLRPEPIAFSDIVRQQAATATRRSSTLFPFQRMSGLRGARVCPRSLRPARCRAASRQFRSDDGRRLGKALLEGGGVARPMRSVSCVGSRARARSSRFRSISLKGVTSSRFMRGHDFWIRRKPSRSRCW